LRCGENETLRSAGLECETELGAVAGDALGRNGLGALSADNCYENRQAAQECGRGEDGEFSGHESLQVEAKERKGVAALRRREFLGELPIERW